MGQISGLDKCRCRCGCQALITDEQEGHEIGLCIACWQWADADPDERHGVIEIPEAVHSCQHEGCEKTDAIECILRYGGTAPDLVNWFCVDHCNEEGYCWGCGEFWAGIDSFDFGEAWGGPPGLCENCAVEFAQPDEDETDGYAWSDAALHGKEGA